MLGMFLIREEATPVALCVGGEQAETHTHASRYLGA